MKPLVAGNLRQRVQLFDVPETAQDSYGQPSTTGNLIGTFWADVEMLKGAEMLNVRQMWATATHQVTMRWLGSAIPAGPNNPSGLIIERMYLIDVMDGSRLNVLNAKNVDKRNYMWLLTCEEHRAN